MGTTPELAALVFGGAGCPAGVFGFPPAPTVVQAPADGGLGAAGEDDIFPARLAKLLPTAELATVPGAVDCAFATAAASFFFLASSSFWIWAILLAGVGPAVFCATLVQADEVLPVGVAGEPGTAPQLAEAGKPGGGAATAA